MRPDTAPVNCELGLLRPLVFAGSTPPDRRVGCCGFANKALWSRSLGLPATYDDSFTLMTLRTFWSCLRFDVHTHLPVQSTSVPSRPEPLASILRNRAQHEPPSQPSLSLSTNLTGIIESASTCLRSIPPLAASHSSSFVGHSSRRISSTFAAMCCGVLGFDCDFQRSNSVLVSFFTFLMREGVEVHMVRSKTCTSSSPSSRQRLQRQPEIHRPVYVLPCMTENLDRLCIHYPRVIFAGGQLHILQARPIASGTSSHFQHSFLTLLAMALEERELLVAIDRE